MKPKLRTWKRARAESGQGAVYAGCYPRCRAQVFVEGVASRSESVVKARERRATVAWLSPGLGLGIYIESETMRQCVLREGNE